MDKIVFGEYTVQDLLIVAGAVIGVIVLLVVLKKIFGGGKQPAHVQSARCQECGWTGQVSRYAGRCPKCNRPLGDQAATPYRK